MLGTIKHTIEELGTTLGIALDCKIEYELTAGDAGDYFTPPSPQEFEILSVEVTSLTDAARTILRPENPSWFAMLDIIARRALSYDDIYERVTESYAAADEDWRY